MKLVRPDTGKILYYNFKAPPVTLFANKGGNFDRRGGIVGLITCVTVIMRSLVCHMSDALPIIWNLNYFPPTTASLSIDYLKIELQNRKYN